MVYWVWRGDGILGPQRVWRGDGILGPQRVWRADGGISGVPGDNISDDSPISLIEAVSDTLSASSVSSDSSSAILSPGITIFLSIYFHFHVACSRAVHVLFGNDLNLVCATNDLYTL